MEKIIKDLTDFIETNSDKYFAHPGDRFINRNALLDHLDELKSSLPKPVEVPEVKQCVADWYEDNKKELDNKIWLYCNEWGRHDRRDPFYQWFKDTKNNPIETLIRMKDGYTVVKEPEWIVKTPKNNYFLVFGNDESTLIDSVPFAEIGDKHQARIFMDKTKADAVATLIEGEVVPVEDDAE